MFNNLCDFTALVGEPLLTDLNKEFQYQMMITDGEYFFWEDQTFIGVPLEPALTAEAQAVLQYFSHCACPISMLRLGRSLAKRNIEHGPIISDHLALEYLLKGFEIIDNSLYDPMIKAGMLFIMNKPEFKAACALTLSYEMELNQRILCPEIRALIERGINLSSSKVQ